MARRTGRPPGLRPDGPEIKRLRVRVHGLSAAELGAKVGYSEDAVWLAERSQGISELFASRLAKVLGVEVEDIASEPEPKVPAA